MNSLTIDRNLFMQIGLDSGSLTMLGTVVHSFGVPGEYRGTVRKEGKSKGVFYLSVDKSSPVAQANIDLAGLVDSASKDFDKGCGCERSQERFSVNPRGYALFRVSGGQGGYDVHIRRADESEDTEIFDSRKLDGGDLFAATILRPGRYAISNALGKGRCEAVVSYPTKEKRGSGPSPPARIHVTARGFDPDAVKLKPAQGLIFECEAPSRIKIELLEPDDGP